MKQVHIGKLIERKFNESGLTKKAFADKIGYSQRHLYTIFEKESIDTALLTKIGTTLHHDFFESFIPTSKKNTSAEEANSNYGATNIRLKLEILIEGKFNKKEILSAVKEELDRIV